MRSRMMNVASPVDPDAKATIGRAASGERHQFASYKANTIFISTMSLRLMRSLKEGGLSQPCPISAGEC